MQADDDDDEALEPHTDVDDERYHEQNRNVQSNRADPQELRDYDIAHDQQQVDITIGSEQAVHDQEMVEYVAAVKAHEEFNTVAVGDDDAGGEHDFGHDIQMAHGDEVF